MTWCPNECPVPQQMVLVSIPASSFLHVMQDIYTPRDGVDTVDIQPSGEVPQMWLDVNQAPYKTQNYFAGRRSLEDSDAAVIDVRDGEVRVEFDCTTVVFGNKCEECGSLTHYYLGNLAQYDLYDPTAQDEWIAPQLV